MKKGKLERVAKNLLFPVELLDRAQGFRDFKSRELGISLSLSDAVSMLVKLGLENWEA